MEVFDCRSDLDFCFPGYDKSTALAYCDFQEFVEKFSSRILNYESYISVASFFINIFHFIILTRKPIRTSSVNIIMTAIAIVEILSLFYNFKTSILYWLRTNYKCFNSNSHASVLIDLCFIKLRDFARRCSPWLCLSIAMIRALVIRNPMSQKFEKLSMPRASVVVIFGILSISLFMDILDFFGYKIASQKNYSPCSKDDKLEYAILLSKLYSKNDGFLIKLYSTSNAMISHIIPSILFPIVTFFLVNVLRKAKKSRKLVSKTDSNTKSTKIIIYTAIIFLIVELPLGINLAIIWFFNNSVGIKLILDQFEALFYMLLTANTISHFFVCFVLSSQYRATLIDVVSCGISFQKNRIGNLCKSRKSSQQNVITVNAISI
ncbi:G-protein coupled receptors family 1 profile domain-containing protein [Caenorhabditis elegans]|uniref:G-protein coupled receptors family 1 profile domain-containing protein n=1 Tax=Caenorhabditis elegans TaxID=6239 RepID=O61945_CAEEL|nr:G-protein coupled receptors family 1 profile domain-containing protein [Caenorhabditis elegans]CCD63583.2 G-protein coupled receptors family 1 profile domain-containing protein [Caenorhabditis elegans]|eukprot:NP_503993.3 Serpentine Receptor, class W [Caenorhabditis elegans]